jgi:pSer/pThr/pTyr-binding forkhead associated (FHA) protein
LLRVSQSGVYVKDLGSHNGTLVNGVRVVREQQLVEGDHLQVGPLVFEVRLEFVPEVELEPTVHPPGEPTLDETGSCQAETKEQEPLRIKPQANPERAAQPAR